MLGLKLKLTFGSVLFFVRGFPECKNNPPRQCPSAPKVTPVQLGMHATQAGQPGTGSRAYGPEISSLFSVSQQPGAGLAGLVMQREPCWLTSPTCPSSGDVWWSPSGLTLPVAWISLKKSRCSFYVFDELKGRILFLFLKTKRAILSTTFHLNNCWTNGVTEEPTSDHKCRNDAVGSHLNRIWLSR